MSAIMPSADVVRILICHSSPIVCAGIESIMRADPGLAVVGCAAECQQALRGIVLLHPDLAIFELDLPCVGGMPVVASVSRQGLPIRTVLMSDAWSGSDVYASMTLGVDGYVTTGATAKSLLNALRGASEGRLMLCEAAQWALRDHVQQRAHMDRATSGVAPGSSPTARESQVLRCMAEGVSLIGTARRLHMSISTVKNHRHSLFEKLGTSNAPAAVYVAARSGLLASDWPPKAT